MPRTLELKIPPVAIAILILAAMWGVTLVVSSADASRGARAASAVVLALIGSGLGVAGVATFRQAGTTVNPTKPDTVSTMVTSGIYGVTRNPMYLGMLFLLLSYAAYLANIAALVVALTFVPYMNRFQIAPEERALRARFGAEFDAYMGRVGRWL